MGAPKGNKYWQLAHQPGRPRAFDSPDELLNQAIEYFEWCDENPWIKKEAIKSGDLAGTTMDIELDRPYTLSGLCVFLDIHEDTFRNYSDKEKHKEFFKVTSKIEKIIRTQKFEGATVGTFNANIIARDLGLAEKKEVEKSTTVYTPEEREKRIKELKDKLGVKK